VKEDVEPKEVDVDVAKNMKVIQEMASAVSTPLSDTKGDQK